MFKNFLNYVFLVFLLNEGDDLLEPGAPISVAQVYILPARHGTIHPIPPNVFEQVRELISTTVPPPGVTARRNVHVPFGSEYGTHQVPALRQVDVPIVQDRAGYRDLSGHRHRGVDPVPTFGFEYGGDFE